MLEGLTSRWTIPSSCAWASASQSAIPIPTMSRSDSRPSSSSCVQRPAAHQLGDQIGTLVVDRRLVEGHDPRMRETGGRAGLALEAAADDPLRGQDLDRHIALQALVAGHPDRAEGSGAEPAVEAVAVQDEREAAPRRCRSRAPAGRRRPVADCRVGGSVSRAAVLGCRAVRAWLALMVRLFHAAGLVPAAARPRADRRPCTAKCAWSSSRAAGHTAPSQAPERSGRSCRSSTRWTSLVTASYATAPAPTLGGGRRPPA